MSEPVSLEQRVAALEERLGMEAGLRASADRDLSDVREQLRAQNSLLQALATNQSHHTAILAEHTGMHASHTDRLRTLQTGVNQIIGMLDRLIGDA